ncbi:MAG: hypothetical protein CBC73_04595 [Flavobacteriales bacterium TMED113]|nr:MAG: hypothetical protein CBC73_04595 [Flavobacteriales bacterium TMED113]
MRFLYSILIKNHVFIIFIFLFVVCFSLIFKINPYHENISFNLIDNMFNKMHSSKTEFINYFSLDKKNTELNIYIEKLKNDILILKSKNNYLKSEIEQNSININLNDSLFKRYKYIHARVEKNNWTLQKNIILLNKGRNNGIKKGMQVHNKNGVIGSVSKVTKSFCQVKTLLHLNTFEYVEIRKKNNLLGVGFLTWDGQSKKFAQLDIGIDIRVNIGDSIFSSKGIYVGKINEIKPKISSNGQKVQILLGVDFKRIDEVYILKDILFDELNDFQK